MKRKIAIWNNYTTFAHNRLFDSNAYGIGEDLGYPIIHLKQRLNSLGFEVETLDMDSPEAYEKIIFLDYPNPQNLEGINLMEIPKEKKYLVLEECSMIYKPNKDPNLTKNFHKVFTYDDELVAACNYTKLNYPNKIKEPTVQPFNDKRLLTLIAGNKTSKEPGELYSERLRAILFMENYVPNEFDFYGIGWDKRVFPRFNRVLSKIPGLISALAKKHPCYKGKIDSKTKTLSNYKFCICYENSNAIYGYITEKIWDCFFSGCIPIYLGAPNICNYIPKNCFIDRRDYSSYDELLRALHSMPEYIYNEYIDNAAQFIKSDKAYAFSAEHFADVIINNMGLN